MKVNWKKWGEYALIGIGLAVLAYVGLRAWKSHEANVAAQDQAAASQADSDNSDLLNAVQALTAGGSAEQGAIGAPAPTPTPTSSPVAVPPITTVSDGSTSVPTPTPSQAASSANGAISSANGAITQTGAALSNGNTPTYATATQAEVGQIFELAFGRAPQQEGLDFWTNAIATEDLTPAQAMQQIIESSSPTDYAKFASQYPSIAATTPDTAGIAKYGSGSSSSSGSVGSAPRPAPAPGPAPAPTSGNIPGTGMPLPPTSPITVLKNALS